MCRERTVALAQVAAAERAKVVYVYDFGDDWRHDVVVEKIVPAEPGVAYPRCTGGGGGGRTAAGYGPSTSTRLTGKTRLTPVR